MKLESFYEALRRNLSRLQPDYSNSDWERFQNEVPLPPAPIRRTKWAQAAALVLALGLGAVLAYLLFNGQRVHLEERVQQLTRQRDSLISIQPTRPASSVPVGTDSVRETSAFSPSDPANQRRVAMDTPEMRAAARSRPDSVREPGTESFDRWFNSILSKKSPSVGRSAPNVTTTRKAFTKTKSRKSTRRPERVKRTPIQPAPAVAQQVPVGGDAVLTGERTQTLDLDLIPPPPVRLLPVQTPVLPTITLEQVQQQLGTPSTSLPAPGP